MIYPRLSTRFGKLFFFTDLSLLEFKVRYLALFRLFTVIDNFEWFWMESLHQNMLYINDLPNDVVCNVAIYANDTNF